MVGKIRWCFLGTRKNSLVFSRHSKKFAGDLHMVEKIRWCFLGTRKNSLATSTWSKKFAGEFHMVEKILQEQLENAYIDSIDGKCIFPTKFKLKGCMVYTDSVL
jgi:hypothetical protein